MNRVHGKARTSEEIFETTIPAEVSFPEAGIGTAVPEQLQGSGKVTDLKSNWSAGERVPYGFGSVHGGTTTAPGFIRGSLS